MTAGSVAAAAGMFGPADLHGYLGYNYRSINEDGAEENLSHQLSATVSTASYLWQPWFATTDASFTFTHDDSEFSTDGISSATDSQILTGNLGLNLLPKSKMPFSVRLNFSDSRVSREQAGGTPITFVGEEYSSTYLGFKQTILQGSGDRYQLRLDLHSWDSDRSGKYDETSFGVDVDRRRAGQRLTARGSFETTEHSGNSRENESLIADVSHSYYPTRYFRLDSKVSAYNYDRSFLDPSSNDTRLSTTMIVQGSSFAFWRPINSPWTVSGGARVSMTDSSADDAVAGEVLQLSANAGAFYQFSQYLRFDASLSWTLKDVGEYTQGFYREHIGALYSSKWFHFNEFMYQYYANSNVDYDVAPKSQTLFFDASAGHNISRTWWPRERTTPGSLRMNANQAIVLSEAAGSYEGDSQLEEDMYELELSAHRLNHSLSFAFNSPIWWGDLLAQLTLSDSREAGDLDAARQLVNFQFNCTQELGGKSLLTGNYTAQQVLNEYDEVITYSGVDDLSNQQVEPGDVVTRERDTTSSTASIRFEHMRMFGVPRLRFSSNYMVSKISTEGALDREDWENALSYSIGMLDANVSYRLTDTDGRNYDLLYFRVMRRF